MSIEKVLGLYATPSIPVSMPTLALPPFKEQQLGNGWRLVKGEAPPLVRGYFKGLQRWGGANWMLKENDRVWMSVAPMELESQGWHATHASGRVLIGGAGLGVLLYNVARKPNVSKVFVVENNPDISEMASDFVTAWGLRDKVSFVVEDMLEFKTKEMAFDFAAIDIWPDLGDSNLRPHMRRIARNLPRVREFAAWGMELDFVSYLSEQGLEPHPVGTAAQRTAWTRYAAVHRLATYRNPRTMVRASLVAAHNVIQY